ncbi:hypothetical protein FB561_6850 [Kribbella amoyensis]|uniref:Uncharacterized protein n=1 Tax=Kribbella amoyensis TaxID=996641 RepID=A0A561B971_9ACTN|nr:DUF6220 domain-containing protein [Kribbella amoyensis]TWD75410.1 hypothetical protein FB561_6850 [Kribbella amoyensis]
MRKLFSALSTLLVLAIVLQFFLAGMGAFDAAGRDESFAPHRALGYGILLIAVLLTLLAAAARLPGRLIGGTGLVAGLVLLQIVIAVTAGAIDGSGGTTSTTAKLVFGLHAINAVAIAFTISRVEAQVGALGKGGEPSPTRSRERSARPAR